MTRDYKPAQSKSSKKGRRRPANKHRRRSSPRQPARPSTTASRWPWLAAGLLIGLGSSTLIWWMGQPNDRPTVPGETAPEQAERNKAAAQASAKGARTKTETAKDEAPRFDFYRLLPKMEVLIPEEEINKARAALPREQDRGPFIIQAGSFRRTREADSLKARLALLGIESTIQSIVVNNGSTWHRVRIGPFKTVKALKKVRRQLRKARIEFVVIELAGRSR